MIKYLITIIESGRALPEINLNSIIESAAKNKVLLHILRVLNVRGPLRKAQETRMRRIVQVIQILSTFLKDYNYVFFKLTKPLVYVPADVDILIDSSQAWKAVKEIIKLGYRITVKDPYCITLTKANLIIDLYTYPSLGGTVFLNGQKLLEHKTFKSFNGVEVRTLEDYAEALVAASHAIYKERIYTLNDYFTIKKWTTQKTYKLAQELNCENVIKIALNLNRKIHQGLIDAPYKIPIPVWSTVLIQKFQKDSLTRITSINILKTLKKRNVARLLISKFTRETY